MLTNCLSLWIMELLVKVHPSTIVTILSFGRPSSCRSSKRAEKATVNSVFFLLFLLCAIISVKPPLADCHPAQTALAYLLLLQSLPLSDSKLCFGYPRSWLWLLIKYLEFLEPHPISLAIAIEPSNTSEMKQPSPEPDQPSSQGHSAIADDDGSASTQDCDLAPTTDATATVPTVPVNGSSVTPAELSKAVEDEGSAASSGEQIPAKRETVRTLLHNQCAV